MPFDAEVSTKSRDLIVLEKARERIARGWCKGVAETGGGSFCTVGALKAETGGVHSGWPDAQKRDVARLLNALGFAVKAEPLDTTVVTIWNDRRSRTQAEVLARFDAAIAALGATP